MWTLETLYDPSFKFHLDKIKTILVSNIITNTLVMATSKKPIGTYIRDLLKYKLPLNHFEGPIKSQGIGIQNNKIKMICTI